MESTLTKTTYYTIAEAARAIGMTYYGFQKNLDAGKYQAQAKTADGKPLFSARYVEQLVSQRRATKDEPQE